MDKLTPTRRALLKGAPVAAVAIAIPAAAALPKAVDATEWDKAMRAYQTALAEDRAFDAPYNIILEEWEAGRPSMDGIHWKEFPFADRNYIARSLDLDKAWTDFLAGEGKTWWARKPETTRARMRAALDSVQAFRNAEERHDSDSGMTAADEKYEALGEAAYEAEWVVLNTPAPHAAAFLWKLERLLDEEKGPKELCLIADARRLLGGEA